MYNTVTVSEVYLHKLVDYSHTMSRRQRAAGCLETDSPPPLVPLPTATQHPHEPAQLVHCLPPDLSDQFHQVSQPVVG